MSLLDQFERKISGHGAVRAGKGFTLFALNEDMDDVIKIVESLEKSGLLIDSATETVKHETRNHEGFLGAMMAPMADSLIPPMVSLLIQPVASSLINVISRNGVRRAGKGQEGGFFPLLALPLMMTFLGKGVQRAGKGYNSIDLTDNFFSRLHPLRNIEIIKCFNYDSRFHGVFS